MGRSLVASAVAAALVACAAPELEVRGNEAPGPEVCGARPTPAAGILPVGTFDLVIGDRDSYVLTPRVQNGSGEPLTISGAQVRLSWDLGDGPVPLSVRCAGGGNCDVWEQIDCARDLCPTIAPGDSAQIEVRVLPRVVSSYLFTMLDGAVAEGRSPPVFDLTAHVVVRGVAAGQEVVAPVFDYPVTLCLGCLVELSPDADDPAIEGPDCCRGETGPGLCLEGQDAPIDCRRCRSFYPELCNYGRLGCGG